MVPAIAAPRYTVLVSGATGFIGSAVCRILLDDSHAVRAAVRSRESPVLATGIEPIVMGDIGADTDWTAALKGVQYVIHLAARTHVLRETAADPLVEYRRINLHATEHLARAAVAAGVRRFVFMSSIKVNGERTVSKPYTERDPPRPEDAYGVSKWEAEQALWRVTAGTATEAVVLRPPLVYGPGVKGNFLRLLDVTARGWPLPLASVRNRRSMIYLGNLIDAVRACVTAPEAAGKTYLVSDGEDVSTPELLRALAAALGIRSWLLPCPVALLTLAAGLAGRRSELEKLTGSLQVDSSLIRNELGWRPRHTLAQGLAETARWYHAAAHARPQNKSA